MENLDENFRDILINQISGLSQGLGAIAIEVVEMASLCKSYKIYGGIGRVTDQTLTGGGGGGVYNNIRRPRESDGCDQGSKIQARFRENNPEGVKVRVEGEEKAETTIFLIQGPWLYRGQLVSVREELKC